MENININLIENGQMPEKKTDGAACYDCYARLDNDVIIPVFGTALIPLGFILALRDGMCAEIRPRSGLSKDGVHVQLGTIDSDFRGEPKAIVYNASPSPFRVSRGDRICQLAFLSVAKTNLCLTKEMDETERGAAGFGSTGIRENPEPKIKFLNTVDPPEVAARLNGGTE